MTNSKRMEILEEIADLTTDLLFCEDDCEKAFCAELLCRKLELLGYVKLWESENKSFWVWGATSKSKSYTEFLEDK